MRGGSALLRVEVSSLQTPSCSERLQCRRALQLVGSRPAPTQAAATVVRGGRASAAALLPFLSRRAGAAGASARLKVQVAPSKPARLAPRARALARGVEQAAGRGPTRRPDAAPASRPLRRPTPCGVWRAAWQYPCVLINEAHSSPTPRTNGPSIALLTRHAGLQSHGVETRVDRVNRSGTMSGAPQPSERGALACDRQPLTRSGGWPPVDKSARWYLAARAARLWREACHSRARTSRRPH